jgi:hypothetical protein
VDRFASWEEPICYSIRRVAPAALLAAHRDLIRSRAKGRQTAIDWSYWRSRWQTLPIAEREQLAGEFAKLLLEPARKTTAQDAPGLEFLTSRIRSVQPSEQPVSTPLVQRKSENETDIPKVVLDSAELAILQAARDKAQYKKALDCSMGSLQKITF